MTKSELKTMHHLLEKHSNRLLMNLESYMDDEDLGESDEVVVFIDDENQIVDDFSDILLTAENFHKTSGLKLSFFEGVEKTNHALKKCTSRCERLGLQLDAASIEASSLREKLSEFQT